MVSLIFEYVGLDRAAKGSSQEAPDAIMSSKRIAGKVPHYSEVHRHQTMINVRLCQERALLGEQELQTSAFL